jgi:hypothetical protein
MMTAQIDFFHLLQLMPLESLRIYESFPLCQLVYIIPSSRSPPQP